MKKNYVIAASIVLILLIAAITNPNPERHKEAVKSKFTAYLAKTTENDSSGMGAFGSMLGNAFAQQIIDNLVTSDNYVLFSLTKVTADGKSNVIGYGLFGNVFLSGKIDEAFERTNK